MSVRQGSNIIAGLGGIEIDDKSIVKNSIDQIQSAGSINKNTDSLHEVVYDWVGTAAEWEEQQIATLHPDWIWYITDDATVGETVKTDDISIDYNGSGELEALGTLNKNSSSSTNVIYDWMGTLAEYEAQDVKTEHPDWVCYITDDEGRVNCARNVGDIFYTMRTDSLPGAVECNGAIYNINDFTGDESIGELLKSGKIPFISLSQYANDLAEHGSVRAFGWNGGSSTAFRVPTLSSVFIEAGQAASAGEYISAGLPNITGTTKLGWAGVNDGLLVNSGNFTGCITNGQFINNGKSYQATSTVIGENVNYGFGINASLSNPIYGNSSTVQPNSVKYRAMVQLANANTDEALETCTSVIEAVGTHTTQINSLNEHRVIEFQEPTADNNYTWYRLYADGWVEQGGHLSSITTGSNQSISLLVEMLNANYTANITLIGTGTNDTGFKTVPANTTTTTLGYIVNSGDNNTGINWQVSGMAA